MSGSTSGLSTPTLTSQAGAAVTSAAQAASAASGSSSGSTALSSLTDNYQTFLNLLMTQLQNQDPTSPMDTNQFTTELVQFSSVEQQINTNTSLTSLIQLTQSGQVMQSSAMIGHTVTVNSTEMPVQNGTGQIRFTAASAGPVTISVFDSQGNSLGNSTVNAAKGTNAWSWNAVAGNGTTEPDGPYNVTVTSTDATGKSTSVPFVVVGTATGVTKNGSTMDLQMGETSVDFSNAQSVLN
jgi:flagellar basal-body rod modification protein FlgD